MIAEVAILAKHGYGIIWHPGMFKFWPITVDDDDCVEFWHCSDGIDDDDYCKAVMKLYLSVCEELQD